MVVATASALQGKPVWGYLAWGLPAAILIATLWAQFMLSRTVAEVRLRPGQAAIRSVHDVLYDRSPDWYPLYNVRQTPWHVEMSVGWNTYEFGPRQWPEYEALRTAAREAFHSEASSSAHPPSYA